MTDETEGAETEEVEAPEKKKRGRPPNVKVRIREFRGQPATTGFFYESGKKLKPGETVTISRKLFDQSNGALEIVEE